MPTEEELLAQMDTESEETLLAQMDTIPSDDERIDMSELGLPDIDPNPKDQGILPRMVGEDYTDWQNRINSYKEFKSRSRPPTMESPMGEIESRIMYPTPTAEQEALHEDLMPPMVAGIALAPLVGATTGVGAVMGIGEAVVRGGARGLLIGGAESYIRPLEEYAGEIHPVLRPIVGIIGSMASGMTVEMLGEEVLTKALTKTAPNFWINHVTGLKNTKIISKDLFNDIKHIVSRLDNGDTEAFMELVQRLKGKAYNAVLSKADKQLDKLKTIKEIRLPKTKTVVASLKKKALLDDKDYERLAAVAERDTIAEYEKEFVKLKSDIIKDTVKRETFPEGTKEISKKRIIEYKYREEFERIYRDEILLRTEEKKAEYLAKVFGLPAGQKATLPRMYSAALDKATVKDVANEVNTLRKVTKKLGNIIRRQTTKEMNDVQKTRVARLMTTYNQKMAKYKAAQIIKNKSAIIQKYLKSHILKPHSGLTNEYREQIGNFLAPMFNRPTKKLDETMFNFLARKYTNEFSIGADILLKRYDDMLKSIPSRTHSVTEFTFKQLRDIDDFTKAFTFMGKMEKTINYKAQQYLLDAVVDDISRSAQKGASKFGLIQPRYTKTQLEELSKANKGAIGRAMTSTADLTDGFFSSLKRMEPIVRQLDGFEDFGMAWKQIFNKAVIAEVSKQHVGKTVFNRYTEIFKAHRSANKMGLRPGKYWTATSGNLAGYNIDKETAIAMALNTGNKGNMKAMLKGLQITKDEMNAFLKTALNEHDWKLVNDIWDTLDDLFPMIARTYKEMTGLTLQKLKGGRYYPIVADRKYMDFREGFEDLFLEANPEKFAASIEKGFTKARIGGVKAVKLSLKPLTQHIEDVVHMVTHWKPVNEIQRLVSHTGFEKVVRETMGDTIYKQFDPWLRNLARPNMTAYPDIMVEKTLGKIRRNVTTVGLGLVPKVGVKQTLSYITALPEIGHRNGTASLLKFLTHPFDFIRSVERASPEIAYRQRTWQREISEMMATYNHKGFLKGGVANLYFKFIHFFDRVTSSIVWHGGYLKGLDEFAGDSNRAVNLANMLVRKTQPASAPKDLPYIMRSGEANRMVTMFYSYYSVYHNQAMEIVNRGLARNMSVPKVFGTLIYLAMAPTIAWHLAALGWNLATGRPTDNFNLTEMMKGAGVNAMSGMPIVRDAASSIVMGYDYRVSPVVDMGTEMVDVGKAAMKIFDEDKEFTKYDLISAMELAGYFFNLPSRQAVTTVLGAQRLMDGETDDITELLVKPQREK